MIFAWIKKQLKEMHKDILLQNVLLSNLIEVCSQDSDNKQRMATNSTFYRNAAQKRLYKLTDDKDWK